MDAPIVLFPRQAAPSQAGFESETDPKDWLTTFFCA